MTIRYCDACGNTIKDPEIGETVEVSGAFHYDLCDGCGANLFRILNGKAWAPGPTSSPETEAPEG